jgi:hypothetical protein
VSIYEWLPIYQNVPYEPASKLLSILNSEGQILEQAAPELQAWRLAPPEQIAIRKDVIIDEPGYRRDSGQARLGMSSLTPGYTTKDDGGEDGDDTVHSPIFFYRVPNCVESMLTFRILAWTRRRWIWCSWNLYSPGC